MTDREECRLTGTVPRYVVVDVDDTLIASGRAKQRARRVLNSYAISPKSFAEAERLWLQRFAKNECQFIDVTRGRWLDCGLSATQSAGAEAAYDAIVNVLYPKRGARRLLAGLRKAGIRIVALTNAPMNPSRLAVFRRHIYPHLNGFVTADDIGVRKPDPRAFILALQSIGGEVETAAAIGDDLQTDVAGAIAAGIPRTIWITSGSHPAEPPVETAKNLVDALDLIVGKELH